MTSLYFFQIHPSKLQTVSSEQKRWLLLIPPLYLLDKINVFTLKLIQAGAPLSVGLMTFWGSWLTPFCRKRKWNKVLKFKRFRINIAMDTATNADKQYGHRDEEHTIWPQFYNKWEELESVKTSSGSCHLYFAHKRSNAQIRSGIHKLCPHGFSFFMTNKKTILAYLKKYNLRCTRSIFFTFYLDFLSLEHAELPGPFLYVYKSQFSFFTSNCKKVN